MSIYLGNQQVAVIMPNETNPVGLDEICNHTFTSGDVVYNGDRIFAGTFMRTPITSITAPNTKRFNHVTNPTTDGSGVYTFLGCTNLTSVTFPELLNLGTSGTSQFSGCTSLVLTSTSFPKLTTFGGGYTFDGCTSLVTINSTIFPSLTTFNSGGYHFRNCTSLVTVDLPNLTTFGGGGYIFYGCSALKNVNLPKLTGNNSGNYQFGNCTALEHIYLPKASVAGGSTFRGCTSLKTAVLPGSTTAMGTYEFYGDSNLEAVDLKTSKVGDYGFQGCTKLNMLVLRNTSLASLANTRAFTNTPFASGKAGGTLYVPETLISNYQSATNWVTILGYTNNSIKSIESTHTDPDAPIDLTLYYADGTAIPS